MPARAEPGRRVVLPPLPVAAARAVLSPPRLPAAAVADAALARDAAPLALPVRLDVPPGYPRTLVARALHVAGGRGGPLLAARADDRALHRLPAGASVLLDLESVDGQAAVLVEALLDDGATWLLVAGTARPALPAALASRLDGLTLRVPPLAERGGDVPDLARHLLAALAGRRGTPAPVLTDAASAWLVARPWPGDVAELDAWLGVALLRAGDAPITVAHLTGDGAPAPAAHDGAQLEYLVAQLAHELRNPLTAVKAAAQLPVLGDDPALRARFAALTDDAIARMDALLENASAFAGFGAPAPDDVEIGPLLDGLVAEIRPLLAERAIALEYTSPNGARCAADRAQLAYALRNVLAGVTREAPADGSVRLDVGAPGVVRVSFDDRQGPAWGLGRVLANGNVRVPLPLPLVLARAVLERNGGALEVRRHPHGHALLEVRLPGASATRVGDGGM